MNGKLKLERKLKLACEISAERVIAARASDRADSIESCSVRTLPQGIITPDLTAGNVVSREALLEAVSDVLAAVADRSRELILIIPDVACRIALLDFDALPDKPAEADAVVRFRLKKSLPFDVDRAQVSYQASSSNGMVHTVAVVALQSVISEYESILREAAFVPGVVVPSTIAALGLVDSSRPTLLLKVATDSVSLAIANDNSLLLFRTLENVMGSSTAAERLADDLYPSLVFFQDNYGMKVERILISGAPAGSDIATAVEATTGIRPEELLGTRSLDLGSVATSQLPFASGIAGALIG